MSPARTWWAGRLGWTPEGVPIHEVHLTQPGLHTVREFEALRAAIARFDSYTGPFDEHPLLGRLSPAQWERFHSLHCAHHLSFAVSTMR